MADDDDTMPGQEPPHLHDPPLRDVPHRPDDFGKGVGVTVRTDGRHIEFKLHHDEFHVPVPPPNLAPHLDPSKAGPAPPAPPAPQMPPPPITGLPSGFHWDGHVDSRFTNPAPGLAPAGAPFGFHWDGHGHWELDSRFTNPAPGVPPAPGAGRLQLDPHLIDFKHPTFGDTQDATPQLHLDPASLVPPHVDLSTIDHPTGQHVATDVGSFHTGEAPDHVSPAPVHDTGADTGLGHDAGTHSSH